jgi:hypothetical protein
MSEPERQEFIVAVARDVITEVAPQELPLLSPISAAYFNNPEEALQSRTSKDEPLGFGAPVNAQFLTPVVLAVTAQVVSFLAEEVRKAVQAETPGVINGLVRRLFKKLRSAEPDTPAPDTEAAASSAQLSAHQLAQVREIALEKGRQLGLDDNKAELLADSLVGGLAVTT